MSFNLRKTLFATLTLGLALVFNLDAQSNSAGANSFRIEEPIRVTNQDDQTLLLVGIQGTSVVFQFAGMAGAEASVPIDPDSRLQLTYPYPDNFGDIQYRVLGGNYRSALRLLPDSVKNLLHFLTIPEANCNFHLITELYYRSLAYAGKPQDVLEATAAVPWQSPYLPAVFMQHAGTILNRMVDEKEVEVSEKILAIFQKNLPARQFADLALPVADKLRLLGENKIVESIYSSLMKSSDEDIRKLGTMWSAYSYANTGRIDEAKELLKELGEIDETDSLFGIYCLAQGRLALTEKNSIQALRFLSRAMVRSSVADSFKPEIYFLMIQSYMMDQNTVPAKRLAKEMAVFYPNNMWHESVTERFPEIDTQVQVDGALTL